MPTRITVNTDMKLTNLADCLYAYRCLNCLATADLAREIGISGSTISKIEAGGIELRAKTIEKLMDWFMTPKPPRRL